MGTICPEMPVTYYQSKLRNITQERTSHYVSYLAETNGKLFLLIMIITVVSLHPNMYSYTSGQEIQDRFVSTKACHFILKNESRQ